ncbi:Biotin--acetyl-CoA-carboxylase ligase [Anopheles sinensis]|uniref:Biotin--acetyl-CoA-carboxylase ligase n=1 Tax=Anopheles sinensis TaxID=74873 RepID=A0A084W7J6_ANOSI|nr:Biotin--acetyl-CoA-carboxylase ligase [Anopheles sinensis]
MQCAHTVRTSIVVADAATQHHRQHCGLAATQIQRAQEGVIIIRGEIPRTELCSTKRARPDTTGNTGCRRTKSPSYSYSSAFGLTWLLLIVVIIEFGKLRVQPFHPGKAGGGKEEKPLPYPNEMQVSSGNIRVFGAFVEKQRAGARLVPGTNSFAPAATVACLG